VTQCAISRPTLDENHAHIHYDYKKIVSCYPLYTVLVSTGYFYRNIGGRIEAGTLKLWDTVIVAGSDCGGPTNELLLSAKTRRRTRTPNYRCTRIAYSSGSRVIEKVLVAGMYSTDSPCR
jgi:hypothetical protein